MNITTRKHPRTLQEAFGPYTSSRLDNTDPPCHACRATYSAIVAAVLLFGLVL